jgi:hypothetical protein
MMVMSWSWSSKKIKNRKEKQRIPRDMRRMTKEMFLFFFLPLKKKFPGLTTEIR